MMTKHETHDEYLDRLEGYANVTITDKFVRHRCSTFSPEDGRLMKDLLDAVRDLRHRNHSLAKQSRGRRRAIKCLQANARILRKIDVDATELLREERIAKYRLLTRLDCATEKR